ncbi:MAG: DJ-1/PfpI family protein [Oscillospiraceae bacterium]|nr:DJ-1/PfpI family protein [Oscillospiraceae bacterium]MBR7085723.1 DJ-1/PfpI family protein [Oscillospiraceae bacterium]
MIYVFLANGFEEIEALSPVDLLRRSGKEVQLVGVGGKIITGSHGIAVQTDITDSEIVLGKELEMIVLPGGMPGTLNLEKSETVQTAIDFCAERNIYIGAICAAPSILGHKGLLEGRKAIAYPGFETQLTGAKISEHSVEQSDFIITAQGAGAAVPFGLKLAEVLTSSEKSKKLAEAICYPEH